MSLRFRKKPPLLEFRTCFHLGKRQWWAKALMAIAFFCGSGFRSTSVRERVLEYRHYVGFEGVHKR